MKRSCLSRLVRSNLAARRRPTARMQSESLEQRVMLTGEFGLNGLWDPDMFQGLDLEGIDFGELEELENRFRMFEIRDEFGTDPHTGMTGEDATSLPFDGSSFGSIASYVDVGGDVDVFQFTAQTDGSLLAFAYGESDRGGVLSNDGNDPVDVIDIGIGDDHECEPDSEIGDDQHSDDNGEDSTLLSFSGGSAMIWSNIDTPGDVDSFRFTAESSSTLMLSGFLPDALTENWMYGGMTVEVSDADGTVIGGTDDSGFGEVDVREGETYFIAIAAADTETVGEYWVDIFEEVQLPGLLPDSDRGDDPHSDELADASDFTHMEGHGAVNSYIDASGDIDVFSLTVSQDTSIGMSGWLVGEDEIADDTGLLVEILNADGEVIASSATGQWGTVGADLVADAQYYLRVQASDAEATGNYQVYSWIDGSFEFEDDLDYGNEVVVEIIDASGEILATSGEWGAVETNVVGGETYFVRISGATTDFVGEYDSLMFLTQEEQTGNPVVDSGEESVAESVTDELTIQIPESDRRVTVVVHEDRVVTKIGKDVLDRVEVGDAEKIFVKGTAGADKVTVNVRSASEDMAMIHVNVNNGSDLVNVKSAVDAFDGEFVIRGGKGRDRLNAKKSKISVKLRGGKGNDVLTGSPKTDELFGDAGKDILRGLGGKDMLDGGQGPDNLEGGGGADVLKGGAGNDVIDGQSGMDMLYEVMMQDGILTDELLIGRGEDVIENIELSRFEGTGRVDMSAFDVESVTDDLFGRIKEEFLLL